MNANRKDIEAKLGRVPKGLERMWIGDDPWHVRIGDSAIGCHQPLSGESFAIAIGNLDVSNPVAVKKAILKKATELRLAKLANQKPKEVKFDEVIV